MGMISKYAVLVSLLAAATIGLGEVTLRSLQYFTSGISPFTALPKYSERRFVLSPFLAFGPRVHWQIPDKPHPETAYFNAQGFRTTETVGEKRPGEFRIITLGGSTTEDVWTEDGRHWPWWMERDLTEAGEPVEVYNTGMSAYTTAHTLIRLQFDVLEYSPDLVIVMHNINDLVVNYYAAVAGAQVDGHYAVPYTTKRFTGHMDDTDVVLSRFVHALRSRLSAQDRGAAVPDSYRIDDGLRYFRRNLRNIHAVSSARGTPVVFMTMPLCEAEAVYRKVELQGRQQFSAPLPESFERFREDFRRYNQAILDVASAVGAHVIDMNTLFGGDEQWYSDFVHYNAAGSRRFAKVLSEQLRSVVSTIRAGAS